VVGAGEIVDDSLAVAGDVVAVDGMVTGNLLAAGDRVILRGTVKGDLMAVAERVEIEGTVEGNVFAGGDTVLVRGSVRRSVHGAGDTVRIDPSGRVDGDIVGCAGTIDLDGHVGRDLVAYAGMTNVRGDVGRNASVRTRRLHLEAPARIGGNVVARVRDAAAVQVDAGAIVSGKTDTRLLPKEKSRYTRVGFYVWKLVWLAAAFLVGLALHALWPGLFPARLPGSAALLRRPVWVSSRSSWCPRACHPPDADPDRLAGQPPRPGAVARRTVPRADPRRDGGRARPPAEGRCPARLHGTRVARGARVRGGLGEPSLRRRPRALRRPRARPRARRDRCASRSAPRRRG
jgi:cytoskeletal protein CcmA (bactofilin family)